MANIYGTDRIHIFLIVGRCGVPFVFFVFFKYVMYSILTYIRRIYAKRNGKKKWDIGVIFRMHNVTKKITCGMKRLANF